MWNQHYFVFFRCFIIFLGFGPIFFITHIHRSLSFQSFQAITMFNDEKLSFILGDERNFFDTAVQRLLSTHSSVYNNLSANCGTGAPLSSKDNETLNNAARLLPELMTQLVSYPHNYF